MEHARALRLYEAAHMLSPRPGHLHAARVDKLGPGLGIGVATCTRRRFSCALMLAVSSVRELLHPWVEMPGVSVCVCVPEALLLRKIADDTPTVAQDGAVLLPQVLVCVSALCLRSDGRLRWG